MTTSLLAPPVREIDDDATRRRFLAGLAAAGLLAGCGTRAPAGAADPSAGYPRTVRHAGGSTAIAARPTRVFAPRAGAELDTVLALGVVPAAYGAPLGRPLRSWQAAAGSATRLEVLDGTVDIEALAQVGVDLVVANELLFTSRAEEMDGYRQLAPVLALPDFAYAEQLRIVADALGLDPAAARDRAADVEAALDGFVPEPRPASLAVVNTYGSGEFGMQTPTSNAGRLVERVGLPALTAPAGPSPRSDFVPLSIERTAELEVDLLIGTTFDGDSGTALDELERSELFRQLAVVRDGRYVRLTEEESLSLVSPTVLSLDSGLSALRRALSALTP